MAKCKKYDDGGLTFADMSDSDRAAAAREAIANINARQAEASQAAGGASNIPTTPRRQARPTAPVVPRPTAPAATAAPSPIPPAASPAPAPAAPAAPAITGSAPVNVTGPQTRTPGAMYPNLPAPTPAPSAAAAMPNVAARKAATQARQGKPRRQPLGSEGVMGMKGGGKVSSASKRGDGIAQRGKTKGRVI